jgi:hypothetical protein
MVIISIFLVYTCSILVDSLVFLTREDCTPINLKEFIDYSWCIGLTMTFYAMLNRNG